MKISPLQDQLRKHSGSFAPVVPFNPGDNLLAMNFTAENQSITRDIFSDTQLFSDYVNSELKKANARYGIGGYNELRTVYERSGVFNAGTETEARRLHLGIDIWGKPHTHVRAPMDGIVHSFAFNKGYGDYGTTIILVHRLNDISFYTLYGHLSLNSIKNLQEGRLIKKGDVFAGFGIPRENGEWPPHLHFQIIADLEGWKGDYPGVCAQSQAEKYLANCPDPDLVLQLMKHTKKEMSTEQS